MTHWSANPDGTPMASAFVRNLSLLPANTKVEWEIAPQYDLSKDETGTYSNPFIKNDDAHLPIIKVTIPGKKPIELKFTPENKYILALPVEDQNYPNWKDFSLNLGQNTDNLNPLQYLANANVLDPSFKNNISWIIKPNTSQSGFTFGLLDVGNETTFIRGYIKPKKITSNTSIIRTIEFIDPATGSAMPGKTINQTVKFQSISTQALANGPLSTTYDKSSGTWAAQAASQVPTIAGYKVNADEVAAAAAKTVYPDSSNETVQIHFISDENNSETITDPDPKIKADPKPGSQANNVKLSKPETSKRQIIKKVITNQVDLAIKSKNTKALPQTSNKSRQATLIGLALIASSLVLGLAINKKHD